MLSKLFPPWVGGLESHVGQLAATLATNHPDLSISAVSGQPGFARARRERRDGVEVYRAGTIARMFRTPIAPGIGRVIRSTAPDILHLHVPYPWGDRFAPLEDPRLKVVVTYYHDVVRQKYLGVLYTPVLERLLARADRIIAWTDELVRSSPVLQRFAHKVQVVPGGIDTTPFIPTAASREMARAFRRGISPGRPVVLFVGRLVYYKGLEYLLRAMTEVEATLVIVGEGPLLRPLRDHARQLGIEDRVVFAEHVEEADLPIYYQASDLLVLPSTASTETFGLVQIEAHASGIPTICTALPTGVTVANLDGATGLVVPPASSSALSAAIRRLLSDDALRRELGGRAHARAVKEFDIQRCSGEVAKIYRALAARSTGPS